MLITSLFCDEANREVSITVDGNTVILMQSDFAEFDLECGDSIDEETFDRVIYLDEKLRCVKKAFAHLAYSDMSSRRLAMKLGRNFSKEAVAETVAILKEHNYLNDSQLCREYAENSYEVKKHGPTRIRSELYRLGFSSEDIDDALESICFDDVAEKLDDILSTKFPSGDPQNIKKAFDHLYRLGFSYDDIKDAVNKYFNSEI